MRRAFQLLLSVAAVSALTSCSTEPRILGKWEQPDLRLEFCKDGTFIWELGTGRIAIRHQLWGGKFQFTGPDQITLTVCYVGRPSETNGVDSGPIIWKVAVAGDELTTIAPGGYQEQWRKVR